MISGMYVASGNIRSSGWDGDSTRESLGGKHISLSCIYIHNVLILRWIELRDSYVLCTYRRTQSYEQTLTSNKHVRRYPNENISILYLANASNVRCIMKNQNFPIEFCCGLTATSSTETTATRQHLETFARGRRVVCIEKAPVLFKVFLLWI